MLHASTARRTLALVAGSALALLGATLAVAPAQADTVSPTSRTIDFADIALGDQTVPAGWYYQAGKEKPDYGFVDAAAFPASGISGRALRISNAIPVSQRQLGTPPLAQVAGVGASAGEYNTFSTSFTVASATGAPQPGTDIEVALDGGSGHPYERTGGTLYLRYVDAGLQVTWMWLAKGVDGDPDANWSTDAVIVDPTVPHQIAIRDQFRAGTADEDSAVVAIDGVPALSGGTWGALYMAPNAARADQGVGSLMFRAAGSAPVTESGPGTGFVSVAPTTEQQTALAGQGLLLTDISYSVAKTDPSTEAPAPGDPAPAPPALPTTDQPEPAPSATNANGEPLVPPTVAPAAEPPSQGGTIQVTYPDGTFTPFEWVQFVFYSVPQYAGAAQADAVGGLSATVTVPDGVTAGEHVLAATGTVSGVVATAAVAVVDPPGLAATGVDGAQAAELGIAALVLAGLGAVTAMAARRRARRG